MFKTVVGFSFGLRLKP